MHLTGKRGETEILREAKRHYRQYFAQLPGQGRLWHRIREALPLIERFRRYLWAQLGVEHEELRILYSMPISVATRPRHRDEAMALTWRKAATVPARNSTISASSSAC
jgi:hypothetical protein